MKRRPLIAGNWKMNGSSAFAVSLAKELAAEPAGAAEVLICPPFPYLPAVVAAVQGSHVRVGGQNAWHEPPGAFTGEVSMDMLVDVGCKAVILGHSERRHILNENDALINSKVRAARAAGLQAILCVGELLEERDAGTTNAVLDTQMTGGLAGVDAALLDGIVIAYEPVWAIGTGRTASPAQAQEAHAHLRNWLRTRYNPAAADGMRILYGGSVKADNALELLQQPDVDGALVGGASLKAASFLPIIRAGNQAAK
ncbi:MAG: triose-phosphate isomerase [Planctomycetaceae bacterium]|nr:triose-phosphate isomerase [Planctomycetaceae bacterium]